MQNPKAINLKPDAHWRELGWPVIAKDQDGHTITMCAENDEEFRKFCRTENLTITVLT